MLLFLLKFVVRSRNQETTQWSALVRTAINIARPIQWIKRHTKLARPSRGHHNRFFILFRHQHTTHPRILEGIDHHIIAQYIQLLLVIPRRVDISRQTIEFGNSGPLDSGRDEFTRGGNRVQENDEIMIVRAGHDETAQCFGVLCMHACPLAAVLCCCCCCCERRIQRVPYEKEEERSSVRSSVLTATHVYYANRWKVGYDLTYHIEISHRCSCCTKVLIAWKVRTEVAMRLSTTCCNE